MNSIYLRENKYFTKADLASLIQLKLQLILTPDVCIITKYLLLRQYSSVYILEFGDYQNVA